MFTVEVLVEVHEVPYVLLCHHFVCIPNFAERCCKTRQDHWCRHQCYLPGGRYLYAECVWWLGRSASCNLVPSTILLYILACDMSLRQS